MIVIEKYRLSLALVNQSTHNRRYSFEIYKSDVFYYD